MESSLFLLIPSDFALELDGLVDPSNSAVSFISLGQHLHLPTHLLLSFLNSHC